MTTSHSSHISIYTIHHVDLVNSLTSTSCARTNLMPDKKKNMGMFQTFMLMMKPTPAIIKP